MHIDHLVASFFQSIVLYAFYFPWDSANEDFVFGEKSLFMPDDKPINSEKNIKEDFNKWII